MTNPPNDHDVTRRTALRGAAGLALGAAGVAMAAGHVSAQSATPTAGGSTMQMPVLTTAGALAAMNAAVDKASGIGVAEVVAVVDAAGMLVAFARMDGAPLSSTDLAIDKAFTAASFHAPTDQLAKALGGDAATMASILKAPRVILLGGGVPLMSGQTVIGAIGCSGGNVAQDMVCAQAGVAALT